MNEQSPGTGRTTKAKSPTERWVKLGFAVVVVAVIGVVLYLQWRGPMLGWDDDLAAALARAERENRPVVVFVRGFPVGDDTKWMVQNTLAKRRNKQALEEGRFILVEVFLDRQARWAKRYGVRKTPTMLVISPDGRRFHKAEGRIGELDFRKQFLTAPLVPVAGDAGRGGGGT